MSKSKSDGNAIISIGMIMICILVVVLLITGCDAMGVSGDDLDIYTTTERDQQVYTTYEKPVTAPNEIKYLVPNALGDVNVESNLSTTHYLSYPVYSGLKSQAVQDTVNAQIQSIISEMSSLLEPETIVPFRGIRAVINETSILSNSYISLYTSFSANNLLSVRCYGNGTYKASVEAFNEMTWVSLNRGLTLDLNTGERVPLEAIFIDGYDYERVINDAILEQIEQNNLMDETYLEYTYLPARLTKPFNGIDHDQDYCFDQFNLTIIIETNDQRFDAGFEQVTFPIELSKFGDNLAINTRYFEAKNTLFIDETEKRTLPVWKSGGLGRVYNYDGIFDGGKWYLMVYDQDDQLNDRSDDIYEALITEAKADLNNLKIEGKDNYAQMSLSKVMIGQFISFSKSLWVTQGNDYISSMDYQLYDVLGNRLALDDLFVEGYDFETLLKSKVREELLKIGEYTDVNIETAYAEKSVTLDQGSLMIQVPLKDERTGMHFQQINIPFEVFGVRNMTIFD